MAEEFHHAGDAVDACATGVDQGMRGPGTGTRLPRDASKRGIRSIPRVFLGLSGEHEYLCCESDTTLLKVSRVDWCQYKKSAKGCDL